ncbi:MAG: hypothetical protein IKD93_06540 [Firmicutes bacterium]|nr:hypothetical protein [Bacillota bacterium]
MLRKVVYGAICIVLGVIGLIVSSTVVQPLLVDQPSYIYYVVAIWIILFMLSLGVILVPFIVRNTERLVERIVSNTAKLAATEIVSMVVGLIIGLVIATLIGIALARVAVVGPYLSILLVIILGYIGLLVGYRKREDFAAVVRGRDLRQKQLTEGEGEPDEDKPDKAGKSDKPEKSERGGLFSRKEKKTSPDTWQAPPKVLDTSVIIDGRIADVYRSGFLEGDLIVPQFVLDELRHIADSSDTLRRNRGRGGLDCLNTLQAEFGSSIVITDADYPDVAEVDSKLLKLAQDLRGAVVTNDYNLNKVARLQGMRVLNINELSNAVKPVAIPGEELTATIVKEGKEAGQGVAYLDDGTMIVVENGCRFIGHRMQLVVTSILQTSAGRMVFARPKFGKDGNPIKVD